MSKIIDFTTPWDGHTHAEVEDFVTAQIYALQKKLMVKEYFYVEALEDQIVHLGKSVSYSKDKSTWNSGFSTSVNKGEKLYVKYAGNGVYNSIITLNGKAKVGGNAMSLLWGDDFATKTSVGSYALNSLFETNNSKKNLVSVSLLVLPATTLASNCYARMFNGCTLLTTAPELPATTLASSCYSQMFYDCTSLTKITMLGTEDASGGGHGGHGGHGGEGWNALYEWVDGVAQNGTFIKNSLVNVPDDLPYGISGVPEGWTVQNYQG